MGNFMFEKNIYFQEPRSHQELFAESQKAYEDLKKEYKLLLDSVYNDNQDKIEKRLVELAILRTSKNPEGKLEDILPDSTIEMRGSLEDCWQLLQKEPEEFSLNEARRFQDNIKNIRDNMATFRARIEKCLMQGDKLN